MLEFKIEHTSDEAIFSDISVLIGVDKRKVSVQQLVGHELVKNIPASTV